VSAFSDYIIYADESGDHHLEKINPEYPVFCLALCIIKKDDYINLIVPQMQRLKFDFFGHDNIVLHERELRKQEGHFAFLRTDATMRENFLMRISAIMEQSPFWVVSSVIRKEKLRDKYANPFNPYHLALKICMEKALGILLQEGQQGKKITCVFERRGKKEDEQLELEFYRIVNNQLTWGYQRVDFNSIDFDIQFATKHHNSIGLQLADLLARPIGLHVIRPEQSNRAYEIITRKYNNGYVNKVFP
jgi:hypothetical protein